MIADAADMAERGDGLAAIGEERLADIVTRDCMIGTGLPKARP